jgi:hypothetical protein
MLAHPVIGKFLPDIHNLPLWSFVKIILGDA